MPSCHHACRHSTPRRCRSGQTHPEPDGVGARAQPRSSPFTRSSPFICVLRAVLESATACCCLHSLPVAWAIAGPLLAHCWLVAADLLGEEARPCRTPAAEPGVGGLTCPLPN